MEQYIDIDGQRLHYRVSGSGRPLILMHGWGCTMDTVASVERVAAESHTVYNIDFPGFGQSPEPSDTWGVDRYTRLIEAMAARLGLDRPVLVGHSFGGRVGLLMASRTPVDKLVLIDAAGVRPRRSARYYMRVYSFKALKRLARLLLPAARAEALIERRRRASASADYAAASPRMRAILSRVVGEDLCGVMPSIKAPALLVWGENDTATPLRDARRMEKLIPDAGLVSFPGCGHYSFLDNPVQFAAVLRSFLNS
ncbi:MAG: alpha/beta hydrolase [Muribaculaceae bacterium]|nr:alpha/beta hydrolase [Muribaculaceae bacterium]